MFDERHPIRKQATWVVIAAAIGVILSQWGVDAEVVNRLTATISQLVIILVALGVMVSKSENEVTPLVDPRDDAGNPLVPDPFPEHGGEGVIDLDEDEDHVDDA